MSAGDRKPSLRAGIGAAVALSVGGAAVLAALAPWLGTDTATRLVIALLGFGYALYVVAASGERAGRVTSIVGFVGATIAAWLMDLPLAHYVLAQVGLVWFIRSLYHYAGLVPALLDLGVALLGLACAAWALARGNGPWLALWCFFLTQAFHALIPSSLAGGSAAAPAPDDAFARAHRAAEAAMRRLSSPNPDRY
jgi:hypothetical protein